MRKYNIVAQFCEIPLVSYIFIPLMFILSTSTLTLALCPF